MKNYLKKEITWKSALTIQYFQKLTIAYYKNILKKPIATTLSINIALQMARPITTLINKCDKFAESIITTNK